MAWYYSKLVAVKPILSTYYPKCWSSQREFRHSSLAKNKNNKLCGCAIDRTRVLTKILPNGECGCRGEDGNQSRLNASANLERPVQNRPFGF